MSSRLLEAVDDRGNSLVPPELRRQSLRYANYFGRSPVPVIESHAQLKRPAVPGETIKKLRGTIPITVSARRPNPLIVPLEKSAGKTFQNSDVQLTVHDVRTLPDSRHTLIELSIRRPTGPRSASAAIRNRITRSFSGRRTTSSKSTCSTRAIILMPWFQSSADAEKLACHHHARKPASSVTPKELRYYTVTRDEVDIPFEFADMPMP